MSDLKVIESKLVPVYETDKGEKVVYGTELYECLGSKRQYTDWIKERLLECDAKENKDFQSFSQKSEKGGRPKTEYIIKLDTAKEIAMLERNDIGKRVRKYFIAIEDKYKKSIIDTENLSPQLQLVGQMWQAMAQKELEDRERDKKISQIEQAQERLQKSHETTKQAVMPITDNWRAEIVKKIRRVQNCSQIAFQDLNVMMYTDLERRAGCNLGTRLRNRKQQMFENGCLKSKIDTIRKIDIIEEDKKLREIFTKIVSEYEIKYCA